MSNKVINLPDGGILDSHVTYNISQTWWRRYRIKTAPTKGSTTLTIHSVHKA